MPPCLSKMADRGQIANAIVDGPLAFDNAISLEAAKIKGISSAVSGDADILLTPDLESGNMLAKQLVLLGGATSSGIILGARIPIILTSRADGAQARIGSCAIAALMADARRKRTLSPQFKPDSTDKNWPPLLLCDGGFLFGRCFLHSPLTGV